MWTNPGRAGTRDISFRVSVLQQHLGWGALSVSVSARQSVIFQVLPTENDLICNTTQAEPECIPLMKEENYETIWGRKNSNHPILTETIMRHLYYRESEITDDAFPRNLRMTLWASANRGSGDSQRFMTSAQRYYRTLVDVMSFVGTFPSANICLDQFRRCRPDHFAM